MKAATGWGRRQQLCWVLKPLVLLGALLLLLGSQLDMGMFVMLQAAVLGLVVRQLVVRTRRLALLAPLGSVHRWSDSTLQQGSPR